MLVGQAGKKNLTKLLTQHCPLTAEVEEQLMYYNHTWWQSVQENGVIIGDVRNDEGSQPESGWLGQQEGNILAGTCEMADGLRKSIY